MTILHSARQNAAAFDVGFARAQFAGLDCDSIFFDNAGGSLALERVIADVADYLRRCPVQLGASYAASTEAAHRMQAARAELALLLGGGESGAVHSQELVLGPSSTALLRQLAEAKRGGFEAGDEIVVTDADHESNITPWLRLERRGVVIRTWGINRDSLDLEPEDLEPLLSARTRLVCFTHGTNVLGTVTRAQDIIRLAHERGAEVCLDGVAVVPHRLTDVRRLDADYYVFSLYKCFGPHLALMYGKRERLEALASINHLGVGDGKLPWKLEPGACAYELAYGARKITDYLAELGAHHGAGSSKAAQLARAFDCIAGHETGLAGRLLDYLRDKPGVTIIGRPMADPVWRLPIVSFTVRGRQPAELVAAVDAHDIGIRHGHFYALRLIRALGLEPGGIVRISLAHYNTSDEIDSLIEALDEIL
ncbi:MAG: aminotransferase class V-fold PLP-dependent enzyme [Gammaproteobacteria bacterium]|nr:aminotransferase class V-fold PLP-dependent enzyme [Gammaproteobacteria bacterium]